MKSNIENPEEELRSALADQEIRLESARREKADLETRAIQFRSEGRVIEALAAKAFAAQLGILIELSEAQIARWRKELHHG